MNTPPTDLTAARDDLRIIREALERTAPSFRPLAPSFLWAGVVWLTLSLLLFSTGGIDLLSYLFPGLYSFQPFGAARPFLTNLFRGCLLLLWLALCLVWQREKTTKALPRLPRMVLSIWQAFLLLTLVFSALTELAMSMHSGMFYTSEASLFDFAVLACWVYQWAAPLLFPLLPLLVTSVILEDAPLRWLGLVILALLLGYLALCLFTPDSGTVMVAFSVILSLSRNFLPPIALLLTAHRLKKLPEGA
ncbi:MAG: hypothetical protein Q4C76_03255 [Bacillota bacterium]|nr:hypothetical protein [Bacillota bacterium]